MRRIFSIIITILVIIGIILLGSWLLARHTAVKNGGVAPTFREFLTLGTNQAVAPTPQTGGTLSPDVTQNGEVPSSPNTPSTPSAPSDHVAVSQFTGAPTTPAENNTTRSGSANVATTQTFPTSTVVTSTGTTSAPSAPVTPAVAGPACNDADLAIDFTPDEITRLNALQNRFYAISENLHTDAEAEAELANYNTFKSKADEATELYNYCLAESPLITAPLYKTRVNTPFWRDSTRDSAGYISGATSTRNTLAQNLLNSGDWRVVNPENQDAAKRTLERVFQLNLW
ncbi:MAG TPA: hypothetical protein VG982_02040 [Candidatus Paceibacterota bacterium]|jgi:hypothetical protein|nr:hypothetical protein [Candidatus Paceibacterota bacterium]